LSNNELDCVIPDLSYLPDLEIVYLRRNKFTFEEILPNYDQLQSHIDNNGGLIVYNPQQAISDDGVLESYVGASFTIDLVVDDTVTTNEYYWYKDGSLFTQITGGNELTFADLQLSDAGVYFCEVYNPNAPNAGLFSGYFTLSVSDTPPLPLCDDDMLTLNQTPIPADTYQAFSTLESAGTVTAMTEVVFVAGESIHLLPGFHAQTNSQFQAFIEECELPEENLIQLPPEKTKPEETSALALAVFPNPGRSITNVEYQLPEQATIQLYLVDMNGRIMQTLKDHSPSEAGIYRQEMDLSNLPAGIYMIQLLTDQQRTQSRLVKID
jgi:hypothetical protein